MSTEVLVETRDLTRRFGRHVAVDSVCLQVRRGDIYGFLGLNGAGKTTTLRMILGLLRPSSGSVELFGGLPQRAAMARLGALVESPAFYGHLSGARNLALLGSLTGPTSPDRVEQVLGLVGLSEAADKRACDYSLGMKQRLAIALAMVSRPELVILDEPTNGLDPNGILEMRRLILRLNREEGVTFIISSHLLHEIEMTCTRVGILEAGRMVTQESLAELMSSIRGRQVLECDDAAAAASLLGSLEEVRDLAGPDDESRITFEADRDRLPAIHRALHAADIDVFHLTEEKMSLEELFLSHSSAHQEGKLS